MRRLLQLLTEPDMLVPGGVFVAGLSVNREGFVYVDKSAESSAVRLKRGIRWQRSR